MAEQFPNRATYEVSDPAHFPTDMRATAGALTIEVGNTALAPCRLTLSNQHTGETCSIVTDSSALTLLAYAFQEQALPLALPRTVLAESGEA